MSDVEGSIYFYERFLAANDPELRKARGVFYTPFPVVRYIVKAVDDILRTEFDFRNGIADDVHILDPATGVGTFFFEIIRQIHNQVEPDAWQNYVSQNLLPRLHGFEILETPYLLAYSKLAEFLQETGCRFDNNQHFDIHLANALEPMDKLERLPFLVILGNPPYNVSTANQSEFAKNLIAKYKEGLENETNIQPLSDDYIKFIALGQHLLAEKESGGILAYITNNSFLDGVIHWQMRKSLLETFDKIYILNLHGNTRKKETCPGGSKDENVFDIQQGTSINIFVRKRPLPLWGRARVRGISENANSPHPNPLPKGEGALGAKCKVFYADLYGTRAEKYEFLRTATLLPQRGKMSIPPGKNQKYLHEFSPRPVRAEHHSPGQRPGSESPHIPQPPCKGKGSSALPCPYKAAIDEVEHEPRAARPCLRHGACPGLLCDALTGQFICIDFARRNDSQQESTPSFMELTIKEPDYYFVPKDFSLKEEYDKGFGVNQLFRKQGTGIKFRKDNLFVKNHFIRQDVETMLDDIAKLDDHQVLAKYNTKETKDWKLSDKRQHFLDYRIEDIKPVLYRVFDMRWTYYPMEKVSQFIVRGDARKDLMRHLLQDNLVLLTLRNQPTVQEFDRVFMAKGIIEHCVIGRGTYAFPLYCYDENGERYLNLNEEIVNKIAERLGDSPVGRQSFQIAVIPAKAGIQTEDFNPVSLDPCLRRGDEKFALAIFDYIYGVLHDPQYRKKYQEFLKIDFPRVPYPKDAAEFDRYVRLGSRLRKLHLLEEIPNMQTTFPISGNNVVETVRFEDGRVFINATQYFDGIPATVWGFFIGGSCPAQKYLKDRKGRMLSQEEILYYQKIVAVMNETVFECKF